MRTRQGNWGRASEIVQNAVRKGRASSLRVPWVAASAWYDTCITARWYCNHSLGIGGAESL